MPRMGLIYKDFIVRGNRKRRKLHTLLDSGASTSLIRADLAHFLGQPSRLPHAIDVEFAAGQGKIREQIPVEVAIDGQRLIAVAYLLDDASEEFILGADFFQRYKIALDFEHEEIVFTDLKALKFRA